MLLEASWQVSNNHISGICVSGNHASGIWDIMATDPICLNTTDVELYHLVSLEASVNSGGGADCPLHPRQFPMVVFNRTVTMTVTLQSAEP
jgi:hypothetical protein